VITFPHPMGFNTVKAALALNPKPAFGLSSAANPVPLPQPKPRAMREHFVMPSISGRQVTCAEWPNIRRFEHFLELLDLVNDAFDVHTVSISDQKDYGGQMLFTSQAEQFLRLQPWIRAKVRQSVQAVASLECILYPEIVCTAGRPIEVSTIRS
jgi:hypothetical protein